MIANSVNKDLIDLDISVSILLPIIESSVIDIFYTIRRYKQRHINEPEAQNARCTGFICLSLYMLLGLSEAADISIVTYNHPPLIMPTKTVTLQVMRTPMAIIGDDR